jgi:hypothetical protein
MFIVPWDLGELMDAISLDAVNETTGSVEGSKSGTATWWFREEESESPTRDFAQYTVKITFDNYADDGSGFEGVLAGEGSYYSQDRMEETYTGVEVVPKGVGDALTYSELNHMNFSAFYYSDLNDEEKRSGWATRELNVEDIGGVEPWSMEFGANIALTDFDDDFYLGLLDAEANMAWDGSFTTYKGQGTVCVEGDAEYHVIGCFDIVFDIRWDVNGYGEPVEDYPLDGTMEVSTISASAMFEFGSSASDPTCFTVSVDADNDDVYEFEEEICD